MKMAERSGFRKRNQSGSPAGKPVDRLQNPVETRALTHTLSRPANQLFGKSETLTS